MGGAHAEMKSPLVFGVKAAKSARCTLHIEATSKGGARLVVSVDDKKALEREFRFDPKRQKGEWSSTVNEDAALDIPPGVHAIRIENHGADWIRIDGYRFENLLEPAGEDISRMGAKASGAANETSVLGMRAKDFAFLYVMEPAFARSGKLSVANMPDGTYRIEWWNTWTGEVILKEEVKAADGVLILRVPESERDTACKLNIIKK
jgi:hypothetical protein